MKLKDVLASVKLVKELIQTYLQTFLGVLRNVYKYRKQRFVSFNYNYNVPIISECNIKICRQRLSFLNPFGKNKIISKFIYNSYAWRNIDKYYSFRGRILMRMVRLST